MFYRLVNQCTVYFAAHITMYVFINCKYKRQGVKKKQRRKRNNYVYELRQGYQYQILYQRKIKACYMFCVD